MKAELARARKTRGAFFTPSALADFITDWAIRCPDDAVLEPSCGEAAFLSSVGRRLQSLGWKPGAAGRVEGVEIDEETARHSADALCGFGIEPNIHVRDFFDFRSPTAFDAVVGNPPYVRYQNFTGEARAKAQRAALAQGVRLPGLASSWAGFVVHASSFLKSGGRLGLVLPAELLSVNYAAPVRSFLMRRFATVRLILFEARVFPDVLEEVVLLLAEGTGPTDHCDLYQASDMKSLPSLESTIWTPTNAADKWTGGLIPSTVSETYQGFATERSFVPLLDWGETDLGMVTGNNAYFTLTVSKARELGLRSSDLLKISPPSSRHLRGLNFTKRAWDEMAKGGSCVYLFYPSRELSDAVTEYIRRGEMEGVNLAYKCRVRSPWWRVPTVRVPDLFLTYMNHDTPRLVANQMGARHLNSIHGVTLRPDHFQLGSDLLPLVSLNTVTLLSAELVGRSYGGGLLKIEPREADRLLVPSPSVVQEVAEPMRALRPQLAQHLRNRELGEAVKQVDRVLLSNHLKVDRDQLTTLRSAQDWLLGRRLARTAGHK